MGASNRRCFRSLYVAALALLAACGGTTGLGDSMGVLGDDAASSLESGTAADATSAPLSDAGAGVDGQGADLLDATSNDRTVPMRPPPRDTGAPIVVGDGSGADAHAGSADAGSVWSPDGQTTYTILAAQGCLKLIDGSPDPTSCPFANGCLDPTTGGGNCEVFDASLGTGEIGDPRINCLQTLHDILTSLCGITSQLTPCLCGDANPGNCLAGTAVPNGPVYPDYVRSFNRTSGSDINTNFQSPVFGAGQANAAAACTGSFSCGCLGEGFPDAGH